MPNDVIRTLAVKSSATASGATSYDLGSEAGKVLYTPDFESGTTITPGTQTDVNAALNYLGEHMGGAGLVVVEFTNVSSLPAVKQNVTGIDINAILLAFELSNPSAQAADWTVTTDTNTVTVSSSASSPISGTTNIKLVFGKNKGAVIDDDSLVPDILGDFAQVETSPATYAHSVGDFIVYNNKLYKVTSAISAGGSLVVGTNITQTTVGSQVTSLNSNYTTKNYTVANLNTAFTNTNANLSVRSRKWKDLVVVNGMILTGSNITGDVNTWIFDLPWRAFECFNFVFAQNGSTDLFLGYSDKVKIYTRTNFSPNQYYQFSFCYVTA